MEGSPTASVHRQGNEENSDILKEGPVVAGFVPIVSDPGVYTLLSLLPM